MYILEFKKGRGRDKKKRKRRKKNNSTKAILGVGLVASGLYGAKRVIDGKKPFYATKVYPPKDKLVARSNGKLKQSSLPNINLEKVRASTPVRKKPVGLQTNKLRQSSLPNINLQKVRTSRAMEALDPGMRQFVLANMAMQKAARVKSISNDLNNIVNRQTSPRKRKSKKL